MEAVSVRSETSMISQTEVLMPERPLPLSPPTLRLRLRKPRNERKVGWHEGTIDNEHMGKKKSKCCCIYKKPVAFGESSSEDDEECENCFGHPEKRRRNRKKQCDGHGDGGGDGGEESDQATDRPTPASVSE